MLKGLSRNNFPLHGNCEILSLKKSAHELNCLSQRKKNKGRKNKRPI